MWEWNNNLTRWKLEENESEKRKMEARQGWEVKLLRFTIFSLFFATLSFSPALFRHTAPMRKALFSLLHRCELLHAKKKQQETLQQCAACRDLWLNGAHKNINKKFFVDLLRCRVGECANFFCVRLSFGFDEQRARSAKRVNHETARKVRKWHLCALRAQRRQQPSTNLERKKTQFRRVYYFQTEISPLQQHAALINPLTLADDYTRFQTSALLLSSLWLLSNDRKNTKKKVEATLKRWSMLRSIIFFYIHKFW